MKTVAFTGYRLEKLPFGEDKSNSQYGAFIDKLKEVLVDLISKGYTNFISGMAIGFDTWAAETVLTLKEFYPNISLEAAIPFPEQDRKWSSVDQARRQAILSQADNSTTVCEHYHKGCFFMRNEYMVDKATVIVCCFDGQKGGTAQTIAYAKRKDKVIIQINPNDASASTISRRNLERADNQH